MPKKGRSEEQILRALRQAESGTKVSEICREYSISCVRLLSGARITRHVQNRKQLLHFNVPMSAGAWRLCA
jgi:hypothetical protein